MHTPITILSLSLLGLLALGGQASGEGTPATTVPPLVLLPVEGECPYPALSNELEQSLNKVGQKVQLASLKLDELILALGCSSANVACLQKIGESVNASGLIIGNVGQAAGTFELTLRWFDVKTGGDAGQARRTLPADEGPRRAMLQDAVRELLGVKEQSTATTVLTGGLSISATIPYVEVFLDGQPRGALPLELREIKPAVYAVEARRDGYLTWRGEAKVETNKITQLEIEMIPAPDGVAAPSFMESIHLRTWIVAGVGLGCLAAGAAFAAVMTSEQNEMNDLRGVTLDDIARMKELKDTGERNALTANILFAVGGGAMLASALLSYFDYRRGHAAQQAEKKTRLDLGPGSVRLQLSF
jgi:hypothetical protein